MRDSRPRVQLFVARESMNICGLHTSLAALGFRENRAWIPPLPRI